MQHMRGHPGSDFSKCCIKPGSLSNTIEVSAVKVGSFDCIVLTVLQQTEQTAGKKKKK